MRSSFSLAYLIESIYIFKADIRIYRDTIEFFSCDIKHLYLVTVDIVNC